MDSIRSKILVEEKDDCLYLLLPCDIEWWTMEFVFECRRLALGTTWLSNRFDQDEGKNPIQLKIVFQNQDPSCIADLDFDFWKSTRLSFDQGFV